MPSEEEVRIVINAIDNASVALQQVKDSLAGTAEETDKASASQAEAARSSKEATSAYGGLKESVEGVRQGFEQFAGAIQSVMELGGLVIAIDAVKQAFGEMMDVGAEAGKIANVEQGFEHLASTAGESAGAITRAMADASRGMLDDTDLMQMYIRATITGSQQLADQLPQIITLAMAESAQGVGEFRDVLDSLIRGIEYGSPRMLRYAGIVLDASQVYDKYAESVGKSTNQLTEQERQQALLNAAMDEAKSKLGDLDAAAKEYHGAEIDQLRAAGQAWDEYWKKRMGPGIQQAAGGVAQFIRESTPGSYEQAERLFSNQRAIQAQAAQEMTTVDQIAMSVVRDLNVASLSTEQLNRLIEQVTPISAEAAQALRDMAGQAVSAGTKGGESLQHLNEAAKDASDGLKQAQAAAQNLADTAQILAGVAPGLAAELRDIGAAAAGAGSQMEFLKQAASTIVAGRTAARADEWSAAKAAVAPTSYDVHKYGEDVRVLADGLAVANARFTEQYNLWEMDTQAAKHGSSAVDEYTRSLQNYFDAYQSGVAALLQPTQSTDFSKIEDQLGMHQDQWDEYARRMADIVKLGSKSPFAAMYGISDKGQALTEEKAFYSGQRLEQVNWDAVARQYQEQIQAKLGQQALVDRAMQELSARGLGPEKSEVMKALGFQAPAQGADAASQWMQGFSDQWMGNKKALESAGKDGATWMMQAMASGAKSMGSGVLGAIIEAIWGGGVKDKVLSLLHEQETTK